MKMELGPGLLAILVVVTGVCAADVVTRESRPAAKEVVVVAVVVETPATKEAVVVTEIPKPPKAVQPGGPLSAAIGKPIVWITDNAVRADGWQLSGYSWVGLDKNFNPWRFKIGIVSGEMELSKPKYDPSFAIHRHRDHDDPAERGIGFGFFFSKDF